MQEPELLKAEEGMHVFLTMLHCLPLDFPFRNLGLKCVVIQARQGCPADGLPLPSCLLLLPPIASAAIAPSFPLGRWTAPK